MRKRSGTKFIAKADCDCGNIRLKAYKGKIFIACPCKPPRTIDSEGNYRSVK